jgi:hypothetical protein
MTTKENMSTRFQELLREIDKGDGEPEEWVEIHLLDGNVIRCKSLLFVAFDPEGAQKRMVTGANGGFTLKNLLTANEAFMELTQQTGSHLLKQFPEKYGRELEGLSGHMIKKILKDILDSMEEDEK